MRFFQLLCAIALSGLILNSAAYADFMGPGRILAIERSYFTGVDIGRGENPNEVGKGPTPFILETDLNVPGCGGSSWIGTTDTPGGKEVYAAALAAFLAGKKVQLYPNSCTRYQGRWYVSIGGLRILP